jgi:hypothetical protein
MFHEDYYRIEDAANKLEIKTHTLIKRATEGKIQICVVLPSEVTDYRRKKSINLRLKSHRDLVNRLILGDIDRNEKHSALIDTESKSKGSMVEIKIPLYPSIPYAIPKVYLSEFAKYNFSKPDIYHGGTCEQIECPDLQKIGDDGLVIEEYLYELNGVKITPCNDIVITHTELTRLLALKAEHDGKPTAEQLQQQLDEANARIAELEAQLSQQDKEESVKGFNTSLAIIHALYDMADSPPIKTVAAKTEEIGRIIKEDAIRNRLNNTTFKE